MRARGAALHYPESGEVVEHLARPARATVQGPGRGSGALAPLWPAVAMTTRSAVVPRRPPAR